MSRTEFISSILFTFILNISINVGYCTPHEYSEFSGIYSDGKRVGFNKTTFTEDGDTLKINEHTKLKMILLGTESDMEINSTYLLDKGKIYEFTFRMQSQKVSIEAEGKREGNKIIITTPTTNGPSRFSIKLDSEPIVSSYLNKWLAKNGLAVGKKHSTYIFEPTTLLIGGSLEDLRAEIEIVQKESIEIASGKFSTYKYVIDINDSINNVWITEKGELIKDVSSIGLIAIKEIDENLQNNGLQRVDITEKTAISASESIDNPRKLKSLKVRLIGLQSYEEFSLNDSYRQFLHDDILIIKTEDISSYKHSSAIPNHDLVLTEYLKPTKLIQSENETITQLANNIVGRTTNPMDKVRLLSTWIYNNLEKKPTVSIPNALEVLKSKSGDCNEHSVLFTALSRAVDIPTKIILGIVYLNGKFYYHAWNEVYVGNWVTVDSTLNQMPVDASHIKFFEGDISKSTEIMKLVGKLDLHIIDAS